MIEQPAADASRARDAMYRTAFGFAGATGDAPPAIPRRLRRSIVLAISTIPFLASAAYGAAASPHIREVWLFSCRLFGH